jgi:multidrug efflux pump
MHISATFIRRPVATSLLTAAILLAGGVSYFFLPKAPIPQLEFPTISVHASLPGASPETLASAVATPLERQFGRIAGITEMTSSSQFGSTNIALQFDMDRDINAAARDVQAAINAASGQLPSDLPSLPTYRKTNPAEGAIIVLAMLSETDPKERIYDYADSVVAQKISQVKGVGQVSIQGASQPAVRVDINPLALAHYGIGLEDVRAALNTANANSPKGLLEDQGHRWTISSTDQLFQADQYGPLIVAYRRGAAVRLRDIAQVSDGMVDVRYSGYANGKPAIILNIFRQPGANMLESIEKIKALLPELQASIPPSISLQVVADKAVTINASIDNIEFTLVLTVVLVVMVIFLFLRNIWATMIPSIAVPLSLIGTFGVMYLLGYSLDNLSLLALAISTGFVVDDAIVVIENVARFLEAGYSPMEAAMQGSREIGFTVLTMSISLCAVFIPILLMSGMLGRLFREFAVTLTTAIAVSLVVSLTTTPMMCARFLKPSSEQRHGRIYRASERVFQWALNTYAYALRWVLRHQPFMLAVTLATFCLSVYLYVIIPKGFFPQQDTGRLEGSIIGAQDMSFSTLHEKLRQYLKILEADPAGKNVTGNSGGGSENTGQVRIDLKPLEERKATAFEIVARLRRKTVAVPGATLFMQVRQEIQIGARSSSSQFQYTLQCDDIGELEEWAPRVLAAMRRMPSLRDISTDQQDRGLQATLVVDRDTASRLEIPQEVVDNTLYDAFGQRNVSTIDTQLNEYHVVMEVDPRFRQSTDAIQQLYVRSSRGKLVPLSAFTHFERKTTALQVNHHGQFPAVTISFNLAEGAALGDAVKEVEAETLRMGLPSNIHAGFKGAAQAFETSLATEPWLILAAVISVYLVLGMLYESYIHPLTILSTLPSAGVGALLALLLCRTELNVIALVGIILLIGIVKKNAIMMIDFALDAERKKGMKPEEAIYEACRLRFRPIMMTTMCALLGALPLALGNGTGAELRKPLGISIVGGLLVSQMLTLYTTPVMYLYMDRIRLRFARRKHGRRLVSEAPSQLPSDGN